MRRHARCDRDSFELTRVENRCGRLGDVTTRMPTLEQSQPADLQEASSRRSATDGLFAFERASTEKNEGRLEPDRVSIEARVLARCRAMCAALDVRGRRTCAGTIASTCAVRRGSDRGAARVWPSSRGRTRASPLWIHRHHTARLKRPTPERGPSHSGWRRCVSRRGRLLRSSPPGAPPARESAHKPDNG